jgi:hypothetical protein
MPREAITSSSRLNKKIIGEQGTKHRRTPHDKRQARVAGPSGDDYILQACEISAVARKAYR